MRSELHSLRLSFVRVIDMFVEACDHMPAMYVLFSGLSESFATFEMPIIAFFSRLLRVVNIWLVICSLKLWAGS